MGDGPGRLLIRTDADAEIGIGHVMRCLALAQAWIENGGTVTFVCATIPGSLESRLHHEGADVVLIHEQRGSLREASKTATVAEDLNVVAIVVDGYCFGAEYQALLHGVSGCLMVLDDFKQIASFSCDYILDQNFGVLETQYCGIDSGTRLLLGPKYVLLRREFINVEVTEAGVPEIARKLLLTLGGGAAPGVLRQLIDAVNDVDQINIDLTIVIGQAGKWPEGLMAGSSQIEISDSVLDMAPLMSDSDLAISAAGSTCWELIYMRLPALVVALTPNQERISEALQDQGIVVLLDRNSPEKWSSCIRSLVCDQLARERMISRSKELIDGKGASRICEVLSAGRDR